MRQAASKSKFPVSLGDHYNSNRLELFNIWCDSDHDWQKTEVKVKRTIEERSRATKGWQAIQGKVLKTQLSAEKYEKLINSRKSTGLFYEDEDFPGDDEESHLKLKMLYPFIDKAYDIRFVITHKVLL